MDAPSPRSIVLVEGVTDELALTLAAVRSGRDLAAEGVVVIPTNGAHAMARHLRTLAIDEPGARIAGLYDEGEEDVVRGALERMGRGHDLDRAALERIGFFACVVDLEDELIRAAGDTLLHQLIARESDAQPWHTFTRQQAWQGRPMNEQFRRFIRSVSERNGRYIRAMVEAIDPPRLPRPLRMVLDFTTGRLDG